ncbi:hypothetical protein ACNYS0_21050 [Streptomyces sp. BH034]|uniref:hypothetical protein n=1 Tax=Streptomyces sp. BH034 TaxID=3402626 RepID=UPI003BB6AD66
MTDTRPGPDEAELSIADTLRKMGVGPDAETPPLPAAPAHLPDGFEPAAPADWFTELYGPDGASPIEAPATPAPVAQPEPTPAPAPEPEPEAEPEPEPEPEPEDLDQVEEQRAPRKRLRLRADKEREAKYAHKKAEAGAHPAVADPRKSLIEAIDGVPPRIRRLASNVAAASLGWSLGWVDFTEEVVVWIHAHGPTDWQSIFWFFVGFVCLNLYRMSRSFLWPLSWFATVPAASALAGVLLYAPTA